MIYEIVGRTETGPVRERNEDHILMGCWVKNQGWLGLTIPADDELIVRLGLPIAVADGMGGIAGGATASRIALETLIASLHRTTPAAGSASIQAKDLQAALQQVNTAVREAQGTQPQLANMGTTLSGVLLTAAGYWVLHVGDSRVLRVRGRFVRPLTGDDSLGEYLVREGVAIDVAAANPRADALVNWLGAEQMHVTVQTGPVLEAGDHIVVCSDGLYRFFDEDAMAAALSDPMRPLRAIVDGMIAAAIAAGSNDNLSLIVVRISEALQDVEETRREQP